MPFARALRDIVHRGESETDLLALIELAGRKGGHPIGYLLYCRIERHKSPGKNETKMIRLDVRSAKEAIQRYWPGSLFTGFDFPGFESEMWRPTTLWLYHVAFVSDRTQCPPGAWEKVGRPRPHRKRQRRLQFGNLGHILSMYERILEALEDYFPFDDDDESDEAVKTAEETAAVQSAVARIRAEMRYKVYKMFPRPLDETGVRLKRELERKREM